TAFTTANGSLGPSGYPNVVLFNTNGLGASFAAHFNVGEVTFTGAQEGGALGQIVSLAAGAYTFTADIASVDDPAGPNGAAGLFTLLVDGTQRGSKDLGSFTQVVQTLRGTLSVNFTVPTSGNHNLQIQITRPALSSSDALTPQQYLDNVVLSSAVPE